MAFYPSRLRIPKSLRFASGDHPLRGGIGVGFLAAMLVESIYFTRNAIFGHRAPALLAGNVALAVLLGVWLEKKAHGGFGRFGVFSALWVQLTVQMMILLAYMPLGAEDHIGVTEVLLGVVLSGGFAALLVGPYALIVIAVFGAAPAAATHAGTLPLDSPLRGLAVRGVLRAVCTATVFSCVVAVPAADSGWRGLGVNPASVLAGIAVAVLFVVLLLDLQDKAADPKEAASAVKGDWICLALSGLTIAVHGYRALG